MGLQVAENSPDIAVGTLIALTVGEGEDWKTVEVPGGGGATGGAIDAAPPPSAALASGGSGQ